jgi:hypothetical protein
MNEQNNERTSERTNDTKRTTRNETTEQVCQAAFSYTDAHRRRPEHPHRQTKHEQAFPSHDRHAEITL